MSIKNKNVIIGSADQIFVTLYVDMLVNKCGCLKDGICIVSTDGMFDTYKLNGVDIISFDSISIEEFIECKTITAISLSHYNSYPLAKIINANDVLDKLYIHLTDDEVERWLKTAIKHKKLKPTNKNLLDDNCMFILNHVKNIIAPREYFESSLQFLIGRMDINYIDARDAFKSLPTNLWDKFSNIIDGDDNEVSPEKSIMVGAKRSVFPIRQVISLIQAFRYEGLLPEYKFVIFTYKKKKSFRIFLDMYLVYLRLVRRCNVDVAYPTATNAITYNTLIMSSSHLILQGRGSMSTARSYLNLARGIIHVKKGTPNYIELSKSELIDVDGYLSMRDIAQNVKKAYICPVKNRKQMEKRFEDKYCILRSIYS
ncbi:hypothetical protein ERW49_17925 [Aliivibrio finisterrensis]|uniref:Uncharacterized protein n=1 Tax=Aliivibrio finisterrensis TaxID=511998 RepID=A0A4Q5K968_9GAMM|nr:hypothetical protein [Aliivibrio finisterrensis]RYU42407.1 hypothetical protein ERW49_17925 [Aliivibrio finisterrensis]